MAVWGWSVFRYVSPSALLSTGLAAGVCPGLRSWELCDILLKCLLLKKRLSGPRRLHVEAHEPTSGPTAYMCM